MATENFFKESTLQSKVKAAIVAKYFWAWAQIIARQSRVQDIVYLDLFAGPGRYEDGTVSTPLLILKRAIEDPLLSQRLVCVFNDKDSDNAQKLLTEINSLDGIAKLKNQPIVWNDEVGDKMVEEFESYHLSPTLFFVDPWGYKGLSLKLVNSVLKDWACECLFFFNFNRINMGLNNDIVAEHMNALFGQSLAFELRVRLSSLTTPSDKELAILEALCRALGSGEGRYVLPFAFKSDDGTRTKHHLIFVSKHPLGYGIMKDVMYKESSSAPQGVASFAYTPADSRFPVLFEYARPLDELQGLLLTKFKGRHLTVKTLFEEHNVGTPYILKNYKDAIINLETTGQVITNRTDQHRKRGQCPEEKVIVGFVK